MAYQEITKEQLWLRQQVNSLIKEDGTLEVSDELFQIIEEYAKRINIAAAKEAGRLYPSKRLEISRRTVFI